MTVVTLTPPWRRTWRFSLHVVDVSLQVWPACVPPVCDPQSASPALTGRRVCVFLDEWEQCIRVRPAMRR